jgi:hypothetical protein
VPSAFISHPSSTFILEEHGEWASAVTAWYLVFGESSSRILDV